VVRQSNVVDGVSFLPDCFRSVTQVIVSLPLSERVHCEQVLGEPRGSLVLLHFEFCLCYYFRAAEALVHGIVSVEDRILSVLQLLLSSQEHLFLQF